MIIHRTWPATLRPVIPVPVSGDRVIFNRFPATEERRQIRTDLFGWMAARENAAICIADFGQPGWPGWRMIIATLVVAQILIAISPAAGMVRVKARGSDSARIVRMISAGRTGTGRAI